MAFLFGVTGPSIWYQCFWSLMQGRMFLEKVFHAITLLKRLWDSEKSEWTPTSFQHFWTNVQYVQFSAARQQRWLSIPRILKKAMQQRLEFMQIQWTFCVALLRVKETGKKIIPRPVGCPVAVCPPSHVRSSIVMGPRLPYFEFHNSWSRGSKGQGQPSSISANDDPLFFFLDEMEPKMNFWWSLMLTFLFSSCRWKLRCFLFYTRWTNMQHQYNGFFHCGIVFILIIWLLNRWTRCASIAMEQKQMWKSCWGRPRWGSRFGRSLTTHWNNCKIAYYAYHIIKA